MKNNTLNSVVIHTLNKKRQTKAPTHLKNKNLTRRKTTFCLIKSMILLMSMSLMIAGLIGVIDIAKYQFPIPTFNF